MNKTSREFVHFDEIRLENYRIFSGSNAFSFKKGRTVILGDNGSGKTTLFDALARLGPVPPVRTNIHSDTRFPLVQVLTSGHRDLVTRYHQLIFLDGESVQTLASNPDKSASDLSYGNSAEKLQAAAWEIFVSFREFIPPGFSTYRDLAESGFCAMGEVASYGWALIFAACSAADVNLPLVLDSPFGMLDMQTRKVISDYLDTLSGQQILLISPFESQGYEVNYTLPCRIVPTKRS